MIRPHLMRNASPTIVHTFSAFTVPLGLLLIQELSCFPSDPLSSRVETKDHKWFQRTNLVPVEKQLPGASQFTSYASGKLSTKFRRRISSTFRRGRPVTVWHIIRGSLANWCPEKRVPSIKDDATASSNPTSTLKWWCCGAILNGRIWWRLDTCCHQFLWIKWSCE